jgi:hypothetical protein
MINEFRVFYGMRMNTRNTSVQGRLDQVPLFYHKFHTTGFGIETVLLMWEAGD